jgi:hypothetical protein
VLGRDAVAKRARTRSPLGLFSLAAAFVILGAAIVAGNLSIVTLSVGQLTALTLIVVGTGLLVGAWWGRARWLILVCLLLVPAVMVTSYIDMPPRGRVGSIYLRPITESELASRYNLLLGTMTIDLQGMRQLTGTSFLDVNVAAGNVTIYVPERFSLRVAGHIEYGNATVGRGYENGEDLSFAKSFEGRAGKGTVDIDVNGGIASLYVERISRRERLGKRSREGKPAGARGRDGRRRPAKEEHAKRDSDRPRSERAGRERRGDRDGRGRP